MIHNRMCSHDTTARRIITADPKGDLGTYIDRPQTKMTPLYSMSLDEYATAIGEPRSGKSSSFISRIYAQTPNDDQN
ncbi:hypothetical protein NBM05_07435 [Rothia sp. AR01]|uniref:Uncharacterized protein n=1 Tax=Rothia santali TaxID=2949643 RepID=A0A9X2KI51_9MICC|nr:hypothetical protein [Rothia santali]MCP3425843.1 hypothetical protein [Rothia santali]